MIITKKQLAALLSLICAIGMASCANTGTKLLTGFGRQEIMPATSTPLAGGDYSKRYYTEILDTLYVTCVALQQADQTILLYTMDLIAAEDLFVDPAKAAISKATGIPQENILINATHTHAAPAIRNDFDGVDAYRKKFFSAMVEAAKIAIGDLSPAQVYYGSTQAERMAFVRHYKLSDGSYAGPNFGNFANGDIVGHAAPADTELQLVQFKRKGKKNVVLMNFPAHAGMNGKQADTKLSADFPGPARDYIVANSNSLVAYFIAAGGDQTPYSNDTAEHLFAREQYREYGQALGKYAVDALSCLTRQNDVTLKLSTKTVTYNSNKDKIDKQLQAQTVINAARQYGVNAPETVQLAQELGFTSYYEANAIKSRVSFPQIQNMELRAMTIGSLGFIFAPYEMFSTQGMYIKDNAPCDDTFIVTCSEGAMGYLPSQTGVQINCYEACVTKFAYGTAEKLADDFVSMLTDLKTTNS